MAREFKFRQSFCQCHEDAHPYYMTFLATPTIQRTNNDMVDWHIDLLVCVSLFGHMIKNRLIINFNLSHSIFSFRFHTHTQHTAMSWPSWLSWWGIISILYTYTHTQWLLNWLEMTLKTLVDLWILPAASTGVSLTFPWTEQQSENEKKN